MDLLAHMDSREIVRQTVHCLILPWMHPSGPSSETMLEFLRHRSSCDPLHTKSWQNCVCSMQGYPAMHSL